MPVDLYVGGAEHAEPLRDQHERLAARQRLDRRAQPRVWLDPGIVDVVHLLQEIVRIDAMPFHQPVQRRAVAVPQGAAHQAGGLVVQLQVVGDEPRHADVDLVEQVFLHEPTITANGQ